MMPMEAASFSLKPRARASMQRAEDAELPGRAEQHHPRVLEQRAEVGHRADADEDEQREQLVADAHRGRGCSAARPPRSSARAAGSRGWQPAPMGRSSIGSYSFATAR